MTLRGKQEGVHIQNMHAHDCHQNVTEYSNMLQIIDYTHLKEITDRLVAIGAPISQEDQVVTLLGSLPELLHSSDGQGS